MEKRTKIFLLVILIAVVIVVLFLVIKTLTENSFYYHITLVNDENIKITSVEKVYLRKEIIQKEITDTGNYNLKILDKDNIALGKVNFYLPNFFYSGSDSEGTPISGNLNLDNSSFDIYTPYYKNAKYIAIYDMNETELTREDFDNITKR